MILLVLSIAIGFPIFNIGWRNVNQPITDLLREFDDVGLHLRHGIAAKLGHDHANNRLHDLSDVLAGCLQVGYCLGKQGLGRRVGVLVEHRARSQRAGFCAEQGAQGVNGVADTGCRILDCALGGLASSARRAGCARSGAGCARGAGRLGRSLGRLLRHDVVKHGVQIVVSGWRFLNRCIRLGRLGRNRLQRLECLGTLRPQIIQNQLGRAGIVVRNIQSLKVLALGNGLNFGKLFGLDAFYGDLKAVGDFRTGTCHGGALVVMGRYLSTGPFNKCKRKTQNGNRSTEATKQFLMPFYLRIKLLNGCFCFDCGIFGWRRFDSV